MAIDIADFLPYYPDIDDGNLQGQIYRKKEFYQEKLEAADPVIEEGTKRKLNQQVIVERYFSDYTPYNEGFIYHAMGTGKTCAAFSLSESLKNRGVYKRCIVLAAGNDSLDNLRRELITRCSSDYQFDARGLSPDEIIRQSRKLVKKFYRFETYYTFAKDCSLLSDENIIKNYNKTIFIVDEAHHIQETDREEGIQKYDELFRAFHLIPTRKILLLTGTPMRNDVEEFAALMNLILPKDKQLVNFKSQYFILQPDDTYMINPQKEAILKGLLRGRISYLTDPKFDFEVKWEGKAVSRENDIPQFRSVSLLMSKEQTAAYSEAYKIDVSGRGSAFFLNSIQASLFTFPNGSWGEEGRVKYSKDNDFLTSLKNLDTLKKYSIKYYHAVRTIQENRNKNIFIYCSSIQGSGLNMLAQILRLYGYSNYVPGDAKTMGKRYMILTSNTQGIGTLVSEFNNSRNKNGDYCQVILGSRKIAEGYSFKNIQIELLLTQHWNEAETSQASRRGARFGSWNALRQKDGSFPLGLYLSISKVCAIPDNKNTPSIDIFMLETSRTKDISIKRFDRVIKEVSFDCLLTFERNYNPQAKDGSRECDYENCKYKCDSAPIAGGTDLTTFELYYDDYFNLIPNIIRCFESNDILSFTTIYEQIKPISTIQVLKALSYIVENNVSIINRYGTTCFLREFNNNYYLTTDITTPQESFEFCYSSRPIFTKKIIMDEYLKELSYKRTEQVLRNLPEAKTSEDIKVLFADLDSQTINLILKLALKEKVFGRVTLACDIILELYSTKYTITPAAGSKYLAIYKDTEDITWCLKKDGNWAICVAKKEPKRAASTVFTEEKIPEYQQKIENIGYEGIVSNDKFCIRKVAKDEFQDKRKITTGSVCEQAGWKKDQLLEMAKQLGIKELTVKNKKEQICEALKQWFKSKGILRRGKCGTARKKKQA